ncbi:hypothetical protein SLA2020_260050 [Shorea laevis]
MRMGIAAPTEEYDSDLHLYHQSIHDAQTNHGPPIGDGPLIGDDKPWLFKRRRPTWPPNRRKPHPRRETTALQSETACD